MSRLHCWGHVWSRLVVSCLCGVMLAGCGAIAPRSGLTTTGNAPITAQLAPMLPPKTADAALPVQPAPSSRPAEPRYSYRGGPEGPYKPSRFWSPATRHRLAQAATPAPPNAKTGARISNPRYVTVMPGDTLYKIAHRHRVSLPALMQANRLKNGRLVPGQQLVIPGG